MSSPEEPTAPATSPAVFSSAPALADTAARPAAAVASAPAATATATAPATSSSSTSPQPAAIIKTTAGNLTSAPRGLKSMQINNSRAAWQRSSSAFISSAGMMSAPLPLFYASEPVLVRVTGDTISEDVETDLNACAPQAAVFGPVYQERRRRLADEASAQGSPMMVGDQEEELLGEGHDGEGGGERKPDLVLKDFPGGAPLLRSVLRYLEATAAEERAAAAVAGQLGVPAGVLKVDPAAFHLDYTTESVGLYLEAASRLRCPRLLRDTVLAPAAKELSSRRVLSLLERVVLYTADLDNSEMVFRDLEKSEVRQPPEAPEKAIDETTEDASEDLVTNEQVILAFCQVIQRLCARLDAVDFRLTSALAAGSPWASLEVMKAYRVKVDTVGRVNYAFQSVTSTMKSFFYEEEQPSQQQKQEWKEHHFSLHVFRKHIIESALNSQDAGIRAIAEHALEDVDEGSKGWSDDEGDATKTNREHYEVDVPEAICDHAAPSVLASLSGFVPFVDATLTPPVLSGALVRSLLVIREKEKARVIFEKVFVRSKKTQAMVTTGHIPVDFLGGVKSHRASSLVLRKLLSRYGTMDRQELCYLLGNVLLQEFIGEKHCMDLILHHSLVPDLVVYCRVNSRGAREAVSAGRFEFAPVLRLREVGEQLFGATFVIHNGFLPTADSSIDPLGAGETGSHWPVSSSISSPECPWDTGDLDLELLAYAPPGEAAMELSRKVLLRGLFRRQRAGVESDVPTVVRLWALGRWSSCDDAALVAEAFRFVTNSWKSLQEAKASARSAAVNATSADATSTPTDEGVHAGVPSATALADLMNQEEAIFGMFVELQYWRLQPRDLMTPWAPPQLLACRIAATCKQLDRENHDLSQQSAANVLELNRLRRILLALYEKLEHVEQRSTQSHQKQLEVMETLRAIR